MTPPAGYSIHTLVNSGVGPDAELEVGGLNTRSDGTVLVSTRHGELWAYDPGADEWTLKTENLHQTLGVWTEDDGTDDVWVVQKPELTRLIDDTSDPQIDEFETITDEWGISGDYHEFGFGPVRDSAGNFYVNLNLGAEGGGPVSPVMIYSSPWRGWHIKVHPDGTFEPYASGLRSPAGLGINDSDEVFYSDNQGDWVPVCHISHIQQGEFYGHPHSLGPRDDFPDYQDLDTVDKDRFFDARKPPVVWVPYSQAQSTAGVTFDTQGNFGPFQGQAFYGDQSLANLSRVAMETVNGEYQGFTIPFSDTADFQSGVIREEFSADGSSLYIGQTYRGWGGPASEPYGLQRVNYDGSTTPFAIHSVNVMSSGFRINFTRDVDTTAAGQASNYSVSRWTYNYHSSYGSSKVNETDESVNSATVVDGGSAVEIELSSVAPAPNPKSNGTIRARIYEITANVPASDGSTMVHNTGWYTVNTVP
jgi:hypothetical protein